MNPTKETLKNSIEGANVVIILTKKPTGWATMNYIHDIDNFELIGLLSVIKQRVLCKSVNNTD